MSTTVFFHSFSFFVVLDPDCGRDERRIVMRFFSFLFFSFLFAVRVRCCVEREWEEEGGSISNFVEVYMCMLEHRLSVGRDEGGRKCI